MTTRITQDQVHTSRTLRYALVADRYRPAYHFTNPEGQAMPFDPNGNVFWHGRHHMGYIYQERGVHFWGHVSSLDLLHWRHHAPALFPTGDSPEDGIFSGNGFVDRDGSRVIYLYHGTNSGNSIAFSSDRNLEHWRKLPTNPIVPKPAPDEDKPYRSWDPCGWIWNDTYYAIFGGQRPAVFKARQLEEWEYVGDLLAHAMDGVDINEDVSCPDLFQLGDKWVLVCISHTLGCRYYVGEWKNEQFHPQYHEMMSFADNEYFAPESYTDDRGRRILFAWVFDGRSEDERADSGWSGTMALPRQLELGRDDRLIMTPVEELRRLRYNPRSLAAVAVPTDGEFRIPFDAVEANVLEVEVAFRADATGTYGLKVCASPDGEEETLIEYHATMGQLAIDTRRSGIHQQKKTVESAPLALGPGEGLTLRVFVDRSIVEVFANDGRLALSRRVYPERRDSTGISLFARGATVTASAVRAWDLMPTNPY